MRCLDKKEYKIGDVSKVAAFICGGADIVRIEKSVSKKNAVRVMFVFSRLEADKLEAQYLSETLLVDARSMVDTIAEVRSIIKNTINNIRNENE